MYERITPELLAQKVLYFAYGSNMCKERLQARVGQVTCLGAHDLRGYKLTFDVGNYYECYANIKRDIAEYCQGVVYEMTYAQLRQLDWYEGLYDRVKEKYKGRILHLYISKECYRDEQRPPEITRDYQAALVRGCMVHDLYKTLALVQQIPIAVPKFRDAYAYYEAWYD